MGASSDLCALVGDFLHAKELQQLSMEQETAAVQRMKSWGQIPVAVAAFHGRRNTKGASLCAVLVHVKKIQVVKVNPEP